VTTPVRYAILVLSLFLSSESFAQIDSPFGLEAGEYSVGFRLLEERDHSRTVTGDTPGTVHRRPIRIYLWYPAARGSDASPMQFGRYAALADDDIWPEEIAGSLRNRLMYSRKPLARSLTPRDLDELLQRPVLAIQNATPLNGSFPLIVIGQGLYYESPIALAALAEYLAGRGFVVASSPLVGTNSPLVRPNVQDLETQARDLEFVIAKARELNFVSPERLGVFGFDMGGMAALVLTMRNPDVDAFVSADSSILHPHPAGIPAASPHYDPSALRAPWMHATSTVTHPTPDPSGDDSLFVHAAHAHRYLLLSEMMEHVDFTSYALIENRNPVAGYWPAGAPERAQAHKTFAEYVYHFLAAFLKENSESLAALSHERSAVSVGESMTLEHRTPIPAPIDYDRLVHMVVSGKAAEATNELRSLREMEPSHSLLAEASLWRLALSLLNTWSLAEEALPILELTLELYPSSGNIQVLLGEGHILVGNHSAAIDVYDRLLEQEPQNAWVRSRLEWLRGQ
jgi:hypothetical protein